LVHLINLLALCQEIDSEGHFKVHEEEKMRRYETIIIVRPNVGEDEIEAITSKATSTIETDGGTILRINDWGLKKLAYLIKKENQGYYVYLDYAGVPESIAEIERIFRIDDRVLKYLTVKLADFCDPEAVKEQLAQEEPVPASDEEDQRDTESEIAEEEQAD
jgi:small subunit ribosomal protein S6